MIEAAINGGIGILSIYVIWKIYQTSMRTVNAAVGGLRDDMREYSRALRELTRVIQVMQIKDKRKCR